MILDASVRTIAVLCLYVCLNMYMYVYIYNYICVYVCHRLWVYEVIDPIMSESNDTQSCTSTAIKKSYSHIKTLFHTFPQALAFAHIHTCTQIAQS